MDYMPQIKAYLPGMLTRTRGSRPRPEPKTGHSRPGLELRTEILKRKPVTGR